MELMDNISHEIQVRYSWADILRSSQQFGPPGLRRLSRGRQQVWEYRDHAGILRGVLYYERKEILFIVEPAFRRRGIATRLVRAAVASCPEILPLLPQQKLTSDGRALLEHLLG